MLSVVTVAGALEYKITEDTTRLIGYIEFLEQLIEEHDRPFIFIADRASFHHAKSVVKFVRDHRQKLRIYFLQLPLNNLPFGTDFYSNLSNPDVLKILDTIPEKRNKFGGAAHGAIVPEIVAQKAVSEIHPSAMNVFGKLSNAYSALDLIYSQSMKKSNGLYTIRIKRLQGTHYPYAEQDIQTETDLNSESLYLYNPVSKSRLELLPEFIKLVQCEHCGNWSIYFYSKADSKKAHYISFQNEIHEYTCQPSGLLNQIGKSPALPGDSRRLTFQALLRLVWARS